MPGRLDQPPQNEYSNLLRRAIKGGHSIGRSLFPPKTCGPHKSQNDDGRVGKSLGGGGGTSSVNMHVDRACHVAIFGTYGPVGLYIKMQSIPPGSNGWPSSHKPAAIRWPPSSFSLSACLRPASPCVRFLPSPPSWEAWFRPLSLLPAQRQPPTVLLSFPGDTSWSSRTAM